MKRGDIVVRIIGSLTHTTMQEIDARLKDALDIH